MGRWRLFFAIACTVGLLGAHVAGCAGSAAGDTEQTVMPAVELTDFTSLTPSDSPNNWLVAPADFQGAARPDETAPAFDVPASALAEAWRATIESQPRTAILATSNDGLRIEARQKTAVFGFVDRISVQVVPLAADRSTFIAYSASRIGYWDMGVNRDRLGDWIAATRAATKGGATAQ